METVHAVFRREDIGWSVSSPEAPGYRAYADTLIEAQHQAHEGIPFFLDRAVAVLDTFEATVQVANGSVKTWMVSEVTHTSNMGGGLILNTTAGEPPIVRSTEPQAVRDATGAPAEQVA